MRLPLLFRDLGPGCRLIGVVVNSKELPSATRKPRACFSNLIGEFVEVFKLAVSKAALQNVFEPSPRLVLVVVQIQNSRQRLPCGFRIFINNRQPVNTLSVYTVTLNYRQM